MWNISWEKPKNQKKARGMGVKYCVEIQRLSWGNQVINVEADSEEEARRMALDEAGNEYFSEHDADYEVVDIWIKT
jgi:hypothetical protein